MLVTNPIIVSQKARAVSANGRTSITVHNIANKVFYSVESIELNGKPTLWLKVFKEKEQKGSVRKLNIPADIRFERYELYLDENGKPILALVHINPKTYRKTGHCYNLSSDGSLSENTKQIYPYYLFHGKYFDGDRWVIPTYGYIPLGAGEHTYKLTCKGIKADYAQQEADWIKAHKDQPATPENAFKFVPHKMVRSASFSFSISFDPNEENLWKTEKIDGFDKDIDKALNPDKAEAFKGMMVNKCALFVDGNGPLYPPSFDNNEPVETTNKPGGGLNLLLLKEGRTYNSDEILNKTVGPFPELRFSFRKVSGKYTSYDEAKKHCEKPKQRGRNKFWCYTTQTIKLCPDNYRFSINDSSMTIDTGALLCGKIADTTPAYMPHGENILVVVIAKGYRAKTIALDKKDLQVSDIHLSGTITGKNGHPLKGAKISLIGKGISFVTDSTGHYKLDGKAHGKEPLTETLNIKLQAVGIEVAIDTFGVYQPGKNYGLVSDGFTTLKIHVKTNGLQPGSVRVEPLVAGGFVPQNKAGTPLILNDNGEGDMEYVPPAYLKNSFLTKHIAIKPELKGPHGLSGDLWAAEVPVTLTYEDKDGNPGSYTFNILVCRPPVMLVHGFTGDKTTWEHIAVQLRHDKYDAIVREYYKGPIDESTIERQAQKLGKYIHELREAYLKNGIIQNRVDIVAHSMGGLISRYYISNMPRYGKTAGIWIPYNVKLSRQQLAQQRFQKPVVLNDVRKLIMVGTPNHGVSMIDEKMGAIQALIFKVHQVANAQLRYDSPILAKLNAGESEGRHLDPNVQYALIYGKRRRSVIYPFDPVLHPLETKNRDIVDDDGVVTVSSARLNGVMSYAFPPSDTNHQPGYIHSPVLGYFCEGDIPLTTDSLVFNKIEELLQENIPRVPLKHSVSRIIEANGKVYYRYYPTQNWVPVRTPVTAQNPKKLTYNFCRLKTGEGTAKLGFFLNGHHWGSLLAQAHTIVYYDFASPEYVRVYLQQGRARFRSQKQNGGGFDVVMGDQTGEKWYAFNPKARVKDLNTDFIVEQDSVLDVHSLSGKVVFSLSLSKNKKPESKTIDTREGYVVSPNGTLTQNPLPDSGWWSNMDTAFLPDYIYDTVRFMLPENSVRLTLSEPYLPVSGFCTLNLHVDSLPGDSVKRNYRVKISLKNDSLLPFITVTRPHGMTDSLGNFKTEITFREPVPGDYTSLGSLPLQALFSIRLFKQQSDTLVFHQDTLVPLGMTLITGQTTGPGFRPRKEPPPQLNQIIYQMASESNSTGHFYLLFNTTSYLKNRRQMEKLSDQTQQNTAHRLGHFVLQWPASGTFPLSYQLDSLKKSFLPGQKIRIGKNGMLDVLSPSEQEQRMKKTMGLFIKEMPLTQEPKEALLKKLDSLSFRYTAGTQKPLWLFQKNLIAIPGESRSFWNLNKENSSPAYATVFNALGHFMQQNLCNAHHRHFHFLQTEEPIADSSLFNAKAYRYFHRTEAAFFRYLLENFLKNKGNRLISKSLYYQKMDTAGMGNIAKFLINYYGNFCQKEPVKVYSDFLFTEMLYSAMTGGGEPAGTIKEWIQTKMKNQSKTCILETQDPAPLAKKYGLLPEKPVPVLIPKTEFAGSSIQFGEKTITDFQEIPALPIKATSKIKIIKGRFLLQFPGKGPSFLLELQPGAIFKTDTVNRLVLLNGKFIFKAPVPFHIPRASFLPQSSNFTVVIDPKRAALNVYEGVVEVKNYKSDCVVHQGETTTVNKGGSIKKPRPMKEVIPPKTRVKMKYPFVCNNE